jgi:hypothetical protein
VSALVTTDEVKAIYTTTRTDLSAFIDMADNLVTEQLASQGLSDTRLKNIELWLSAHFASVSDGNAEIIEERAGNSDVRYTDFTQGSSSVEGLLMTTYGRQAVALDTSGTLSNLGRRQARFTVV